MHTHRCAIFALVLGAALFSVGCGDITDSVGSQGRLRFSLGTEYRVGEQELTETTIVAGHEQELDVSLTSKGEDDIDEPDELTYRVKGDLKGLSVSGEGGSASDPPALRLLASEPGTYEVQVVYKGKITDAIELRFDFPDALDISVQVRRPYDGDFDTVSASTRPVRVREGTQATFLPIPKRKGKRIAGRIETNVTASPKELVVPGQGASFVYEQAVWSAEGSIDFYFIDPGDVTITITDPVSRASGEFSFEVQAFDG